MFLSFYTKIIPPSMRYIHEFPKPLSYQKYHFPTENQFLPYYPHRHINCKFHPSGLLFAIPAFLAHEFNRAFQDASLNYFSTCNEKASCRFSLFGASKCIISPLDQLVALLNLYLGPFLDNTPMSPPSGDFATLPRVRFQIHFF